VKDASAFQFQNFISLKKIVVQESYGHAIDGHVVAEAFILRLWNLTSLKDK
jgi:hypothetical protein